MQNMSINKPQSSNILLSKLSDEQSIIKESKFEQIYKIDEKVQVQNKIILFQKKDQINNVQNTQKTNQKKVENQEQSEQTKNIRMISQRTNKIKHTSQQSDQFEGIPEAIQKIASNSKNQLLQTKIEVKTQEQNKQIELKVKQQEKQYNNIHVKKQQKYSTQKQIQNANAHPEKNRIQYQTKTNIYQKRKEQIQRSILSPKIQTPIIFVGNLSFESNEGSIAQLFSTCGLISSIRLIVNKQTGNSRGCGFVEYVAVASAKQAIQQLNGALLDGRNIRLDFHQPKDISMTQDDSFGARNKNDSNRENTNQNLDKSSRQKQRT